MTPEERHIATVAKHLTLTKRGKVKTTQVHKALKSVGINWSKQKIVSEENIKHLGRETFGAGREYEFDYFKVLELASNLRHRD